MTEKRIEWRMHNYKEYGAYNIINDFLGILKYERVGSNMHWCWYQNQDIRMSPGCLQEVRDKQKELFKHRGNENE